MNYECLKLFGELAFVELAVGWKRHSWKSSTIIAYTFKNSKYFYAKLTLLKTKQLKIIGHLRRRIHGMYVVHWYKPPRAENLRTYFLVWNDKNIDKFSVALLLTAHFIIHKTLFIPINFLLCVMCSLSASLRIDNPETFTTLLLRLLLKIYNV